MRLAHLHIWDDRFLFTTLAGVQSDLTRRHTVTLLLALQPDQRFRLGTDQGVESGYRAALVGREVARRLDAGGIPLLSLNFDPQAYECHTLSRFLGDEDVREIELDLDPGLEDRVRRAAADQLDAAEMFRLSTLLPRAIRGYRPARMDMDMRVLHIAHKVKKELPLLSNIDELATEVGLSGERLRHLFSSQMGVSLRSYLLWAKMRRAAVHIGRGTPATEIALEAGFSDSAHLTRTFKDFFGLTPSFIAEHIQIHAY